MVQRYVKIPLHPTLHVTSDSEDIPVFITSFKHLYLALMCTKTFLLKISRSLIFMQNLKKPKFLFIHFSLSCSVLFCFLRCTVKPIFLFSVSRTRASFASEEDTTCRLLIYVLSVYNVF